MSMDEPLADDQFLGNDSLLTLNGDHDSQIRLSRTTSTQTDETEPTDSAQLNPQPNVPPAEVQVQSKRTTNEDIRQSSDKPEAPPPPKTGTKRVSKWGKQKTAQPEDGWDDNTAVNGTVLEYGSSVETVRRIALPARMVQLKPAAGASWLFAKTFGESDFAAAGKLHVPPYCTKEEKSTRDNAYFFYVVEGAVDVKVHKTRFVLSPGAMFLVPRGNTYSITNISERTAKLVFFQGRQVAAPSPETEDPIKLATEPPVPLPQFPPTKATILLGLVLERVMKFVVKYRAILLQWYLKTSFNVSRHITRPRAYLLFFLLGFFLRRLPFTASSRINIQIVRKR